jgi:hypothetical protein
MTTFGEVFSEFLAVGEAFKTQAAKEFFLDKMLSSEELEPECTDEMAETRDANEKAYAEFTEILNSYRDVSIQLDKGRML